jgi:hypothetical protein
MSRAKKSGTAPGRFRDAFVEYLVGVLRGELPTVRQRLFIDWLESFPFICERAGCFEEFEVSASEFHEDDLILCGKCRKRRVE